MIDIVCIRGAGDKQGPEIREELIRTEPQARMRGKAYLDTVWYRREKKQLRVPFLHGLYVNSVVCVEEATLGITGNHQVTGFTVHISQQEGIYCDIDIEQHHEGE